MRISEIPFIGEVHDDYIRLRRENLSREEATQKLRLLYKEEIKDGIEDDGPGFWIGLADGQFKCKELTQEIANCGLEALSYLHEMYPEICKRDIDLRKERYSRAPMPENQRIRPERVFVCPWEIGDTFAYQMNGPEAQKLGIAGKYAIFRVVGYDELLKKRFMPTFFVTWTDSIPVSFDEYVALPLTGIRRTHCHPDFYEYRTPMLVSSKKQMKQAEETFFVKIGNFKNAPMPNDEILYEGVSVWAYPVSSLKELDKDCCMLWKYAERLREIGGTRPNDPNMHSQVGSVILNVKKY